MLWKEKSNVYFRLEQILLIKGLNLSVRVLRSIANIVEKRKDFLFIHILNMTLFTVFERMQPQVTKEKPPQTIT